MISRYSPRGKTGLAQLAPAVATQLNQLHDVIRGLGEQIATALTAAEQERTAAEQEREREPERPAQAEDQQIIEPASPTKGYRAKQVARRLGIHEQTLWRWCRDGKFPRPIKIGEMTSIWTDAMIATWLEKQRAKGRAK